MRRRKQQGFTMMEVLVVVALLVIAGGLITFQIVGLIRDAYHREVDEIAKEIYVAAENHLSVAASNHKLDSMTEWGTKDEEAAKKGLEGVYYYVVGSGSDDSANLTNKSSVLNAMLPTGAIDDTIRVGGSYVIRYQYLDGTALVLDVFYASPEGRNGRYGHEFAKSEYNALFYEPGYTDTEKSKREDRGKYGSDESVVIGWYDGGDESEMAERMRPRTTITNAERLTVSLANWRNIIDAASGMPKAGYEVLLEIKGEQSKAEAVYENPFQRMVRVTPGGGGERYEYAVDLDSIVDPGGTDNIRPHFANFSSRYTPKTSSGVFIPGENLHVRVLFKKTPSEGSPVTTSGPWMKCNSLFYELTPLMQQDPNDPNKTVPVSGKFEATIANIRHLENIGQNVSAYKNDAGKNFEIVTFKQTEDLSWKDFRKAVTGVALDKDDTADSLAVKVYDMTTSGHSEAGTFMPIAPEGAVTYDGAGKKISDVIEDTNSDAGLFSELQKGSTLKDMQLIDFDIKTTAGNAGTLAATAKGTTITNVVARNLTAKEILGESAATATAAQKTAAMTAEASHEIVGTLSVGGLVGSLESAGDGTTSSINNCAAAVYVRSTGSAGATLITAKAGGLVGSATGGTITDSYAAGHTLGGIYQAVTGGYQSLTTDSKVRFNVQSAGIAGGLVGATSSTAISYCYTTASAYGTTAGGFAGSLSGGSVSTAYATGLVGSPTDDNAKGAFAGTSTGTLENCSYLSIVNNDMEALSTGTVDGVAAFDNELGNLTNPAAGTYRAMEATTPAPALPYDVFDGTTNPAGLPSKYPFKGVRELDTTKADALGSSFVATHYGDWAQYETLVVNVPGGTL